MALFWRIWIAVTIVNFIVLSMFVALATLQFGNINSQLVGERLVVLANRTAGPFKAAARIGLPLSTVRNAFALLERARQTDDAIRAIQVIDADGNIVHSTEISPPAKISPEAVLARKTAGNNPWHVESGGGFLSGVEIMSQAGKSAGGIVIDYSGSGNLTRIGAMAAELALAALAVLAVASILSAILLRLVLNSQIAIFEAIDGAITRFEQGAWRSAAGKVAGDSENRRDELGQLLTDAEERYRITGKLLQAAKDGNQ
jgi:hypothetical protein